MRIENKAAFLIIAIVLSVSILFVSFVNAGIIWSDEEDVSFEITSENPVCDDVKFVWAWWNSTLEKPQEKSSLDDCYRENGLNRDGFPRITCCPLSNECNLEPASLNYGNCTGPAAPYSCSGYIDETRCEGASPEVARTSMVMIKQGTVPDPENFCPSLDNNYKGYSESVSVIGKTGCYKEVASCRCKWDNANNNCTADASWSDPICDGTTEITISGNCSFIEKEKIDDCENSSYIKYSWIAAWKDGVSEQPEWCEDSTRRFRCATKLTFFTIASLIAAIVIIIIVYIWIKRGKRKIIKREIKRKKEKIKRRK